MLIVKSYFSISFGLIPTGVKIQFDLYVNSSGSRRKEKFVRIFPKGDEFLEEDLSRFQKKYHQLYVPEEQRSGYLAMIVKNPNCNDVEKASAIKDAAITHLSGLFDKEEMTTKYLEETIENCRDSVEHMIEVVKGKSIDEIQGLVANLSFHDFYTYDHSINVSMYNIAIFKALRPKSTQQELMMAGLSGLLHDLGKIKIPTTIINSPDQLTDLEFELIKTHPKVGKNLLEEDPPHADQVDMSVLVRVVYEHHENFNGSGYPEGKEGKGIHLLARITAVSDFFDAITTKRSYHEVMSTERALNLMQKSVGKKLDPEVFEKFTSEVKGLILGGTGVEHLDDDFDPCMPYRHLPFKQDIAKKQNHDLFSKDKRPDFGKIKKS